MLYLVVVLSFLGISIASKNGLPSTGATVFDDHPCRFLPPSRCWAQDFSFQDTGASLFWPDSNLGKLVTDDESHAKARWFKIRYGQVLVSDTDQGHVSACQSDGVMALLRSDSPFGTDNVQVTYEVMIEESNHVGIAHGFVFRMRSLYDFYRLEWNDGGCLSIVHIEGKWSARKVRELGRVQNATMIRGEWFKVTLSMVDASISVDVTQMKKSEVAAAHPQKRSVASYKLTALDKKYDKSLSFDSGFYSAGNLRARIDNVILVATADAHRLATWEKGLTWPNNRPCGTLPESRCFFEDFEKKNTQLINHRLVADGSPNNQEQPVWELPNHLSADRHALAETSGFSIHTDDSKEACHRMYGSYFELLDAQKVQSPSFVISFLMMATDHHTKGIGVMFHLQDAIPGFRPTPSYYRYSWGETSDAEETCDSVLYHNGRKGKLEKLSSEPTQVASPERFEPNVWHRIEIFVSPERIEVSRNGHLVGQPILKGNGHSSLKLTWGGLAMYCGGHSGGPKSACAFDDVLLVSQEDLRDAVMKPKPSATLPVERPVDESTVFDVGPLADTMWEGVRKWDAYYTHEGVLQCQPNKKTPYEQKMAIRIDASGRIVQFAHQVDIDTPKGMRYLFAENREMYVTSDYVQDRKNARLQYRHSGASDTHCMIFAINQDNKHKAFLSWSSQDECKIPPSCGYTVDLYKMGTLSRLFPPVLTVTDPKPGSGERWTIGQNMSLTIQATNAHNLRPKLSVKMTVGDKSVDVKNFIDFNRKNRDQWLTGEVELQYNLHVNKDFLLGPNTLEASFRDKDFDEKDQTALEAVASANVDVVVECPVCQSADDGEPGAQCAFNCDKDEGCPETRCVGKIRCTHRFTGWIQGKCTKWAHDKPVVCVKGGTCARFDDYHLCDTADNKKKPVNDLTCASPECRKPCEPNTPAPPNGYYVNKQVSDICETKKSTGACRSPARCHSDGLCGKRTPAPTPHRVNQTPEPTPIPYVTPPPGPPICQQCLAAFGEPGSQLWCSCCAADCDGAREACVSTNGFCQTRCVEANNNKYCDWMHKAPTPQVFDIPETEETDDADPVIAKENQSNIHSSSSSSTSSSSVISSNKENESNGDSSSSSSGGDDKNKDSSTDDDKWNYRAPTEMPVPAPSQTWADLPTYAPTPIVIQAAAESRDDTTAPMTSLTAGILLTVLMLLCFFGYRRFFSKTTVDSGNHMA